jgi:CDP-diacylglycerol--serine O-phosphatidyltransferase
MSDDGGIDMRGGLRFERRAMNQLIPNMLTVGALCAGLTSIRFAFLGHWEHAVMAIVVAGILDGLDGRLARLLNGTSKFGAELDSLSDFVSFGAAPAIVLFFWSAHSVGGLGWVAALFYAVCCALRLARFNTALGDPNPPPWARNYFTGVPAPAGAGLAVLPMIITFEIGAGVFDRGGFVVFVLIAVGALMVSRLPTFALKQLRLPRALMLPALIFAAVLAGALASAPWATFMVTGIVYLASIPVSVAMQRKERMAGERETAAAAGSGGEPQG